MTDEFGVPSRIEHLPIGLFAVVMGLSGFAISWRAIASIWPLAESIAFILGIVASAVFGLLTIAYLYKLGVHKQAVLKEIRHPVRLHFFPAISIGLMLLAVVWLPATPYAFYLWGAGILIQLSLTLLVIHNWINKTHFEVSHVNPAWFIPVVGNIVAPIYGSKAGYIELSWFFFSVGIVFWVVLFTIVIYRLVFHPALPQRLVATLFILLAPPAVGFISYSELTGEVDTLARVLFYTSLFIFMLLILQISSFLKTSFFVSSWAFSFPLAAFTIATFKMANMMGSSSMLLFGKALLALLTLVMLWLFVATIRAVQKGDICVPE